jgi:transcriptional regulator with PAS, ATPase and Fis domain
MNEIRTNELLKQLILLSKEIAKGRYSKAKELFELTKTGKYPESVTELAESFGLMMVKVEAREYHLEYIIENLKKARAELTASREKLAMENISLRQDLRQRYAFSMLIGKGRQMREIIKMLERIADMDVNILLTGETGTGKDLIAKTLHYGSRRSEKPFGAINCSAIPESIFESEMFGIEKGVATGVEMRKGKLEQADGGTFLLDEIGDMPLPHQAKILHIIEKRELERVGGRKTIPVDIRLIAATNKDLKSEIEKGAFREDLFYRLNVVNIHIPPLRERKEDIPLFLNFFIKHYAKKLGRPDMRLSLDAIAALSGYHWPGNVRELENEVERAVALAFTDVITVNDLSSSIKGNSLSENREARPVSINEAEEILIGKTLKETGGNKSEAARRLGLSREGLRKKLKRFDKKDI